MKRTVKGPRSRYVSVENLPGGGTQYSLKGAGYNLIRRMSAAGRDLASIAAALGIGKDAFRRLRQTDEQAREAVDQGRAALGDELTDILLMHAREGVTVAAIFLAKARCGWREGEGMEGVRTVNNTQVNIQIPPPMSDEEFRAIIEGRARPGPELEADPR